jgi:hypothetical protein
VGREVWLLAVSTDPALPAGFELPFAKTAEYLGNGLARRLVRAQRRTVRGSRIGELAEALGRAAAKDTG